LNDHLVVWIDIDLDTAWARCEHSGRPLAKDREQFERLYAEREPLYPAVADVTVPGERTGDMTGLVRALEDMPRQAKLLWASSASGEYPAYVGVELLSSGFWP